MSLCTCCVRGPQENFGMTNEYHSALKWRRNIMWYHIGKTCHYFEVCTIQFPTTTVPKDETQALAFCWHDYWISHGALMNDQENEIRYFRDLIDCPWIRQVPRLKTKKSRSDPQGFRVMMPQLAKRPWVWTKKARSSRPVLGRDGPCLRQCALTKDGEDKIWLVRFRADGAWIWQRSWTKYQEAESWPSRILQKWFMNKARCLSNDPEDKIRPSDFLADGSVNETSALIECQELSANLGLAFHKWPLFGAPFTLCKNKAAHGM